jgi:hypothetical protein
MIERNSRAWLQITAVRLHKAAWEPIGASMIVYRSNAVTGRATLSGGRCGWGDWQVYAFPAAALSA